MVKTADPTIITHLRSMIREDHSVSQALRSLHDVLPQEERTKIAIIEYAREAYCLSLHEAGPIAGWELFDSGEIPDDRVDELVMPAVANHRTEWDSESTVGR